jgi:carbon storage regulator
MLVLTRRPSERIQIGENIAIVVVRIKGQSVRLGIEAPAKVAVRRGELKDVPRPRRQGVL